MTGRQGWRGSRLAAVVVGVVVALTACGDEVPVAATGGDDTLVITGAEVDAVEPDLDLDSLENQLYGAVFAVVHGMSPSEALTVAVPEPALPETTSAAALDWYVDPPFGELTAVVTATPVGDAVIVSDSGSGALLEPGVVTALSRQGDAVLFSNIPDGGGITVEYAVLGEVVRVVGHSAVGEPLPEEEGLDLVSVGSLPRYVELVERISGVELTVDNMTSGLDGRGVGVDMGSWYPPDQEDPSTEPGAGTVVEDEGAIVTDGGTQECVPAEPLPVPEDLPPDTLVLHSGPVDC